MQNDEGVGKSDVLVDPNSRGEVITVGSRVNLAWYPAQRKSAWYTPMCFRLIKDGVAHFYDVYTI